VRKGVVLLVQIGRNGGFILFQTRVPVGGTINLVEDFPPDEFRNNVLALADVDAFF